MGRFHATRPPLRGSRMTRGRGLKTLLAWGCDANPCSSNRKIQPRLGRPRWPPGVFVLMIKDMIRVTSAVLGAVLLVARVRVQGNLLVATALCACHSLYGLVLYGRLPDVSIASLYPGAYEYLLPPRDIVLNTIAIFCSKQPLIVPLAVLLLLAFLFDRLMNMLFCWVETV